MFDANWEEQVLLDKIVIKAFSISNKQWANTYTILDAFWIETV